MPRPKIDRAAIDADAGHARLCDALTAAIMAGGITMRDVKRLLRKQGRKVRLHELSPRQRAELLAEAHGIAAERFRSGKGRPS